MNLGCVESVLLGEREQLILPFLRLVFRVFSKLPSRVFQRSLVFLFIILANESRGLRNVVQVPAHYVWYRFGSSLVFWLCPSLDALSNLVEIVRAFRRENDVA